MRINKGVAKITSLKYEFEMNQSVYRLHFYT